MAWRWCCPLVLLLLLPFMGSSRSIVKNLPGYAGDLPFKLETGYIGVGEEENVQIFYYFVESEKNPSVDPVIIEFIGGPGCSGLTEFFLGNGPLLFNHNYSGGLPTLELNPYALTQMLNIIYLDMPVGTGFSYSTTEEGYHSNDTLWVEHAYDFLQKWFIDHHEFSSNPFYIGGASYAGKIVPPLVEKVYEGYRAGSIPVMNIQGYFLGSPLTDTYQDENFVIEYAHNMYLIPNELYESMKVNCDGDYVNINPNNTKCVADYEAYSELIRYINKFDILENVCITMPDQRILVEDFKKIVELPQNDSKFWCRGYDNILLDNWANNETVREALHVRKGTKGLFQRCNSTLSYTKNVQSVVEYHERLTNTNLQSLIYCSDLDMTVPQISTYKWVNALNLSVYEPWRAWFVEGQVAGYTKLFYKDYLYYMTYANFKGAGHVAQSSKPKQTYEMFKRWFEFSII